MNCLFKGAFSYSAVVRAAMVFALASSPLVNADEVRTIPVIEGGLQFISGVAEQSLTGSNAYILQFRSEGARQRFRPSVAAEFMYSSGNTSVTSSATPFTLYGGSFNPGYNIFAFKEGYFQPSIGVGAIFGWHYLKITSPPAAVEAYTQGFSYGFELTSGVDVRFKRTDSSAIRIKASMIYLKSRIAGQTTFGLGGFRLMLGFVH
jgi:hypothetical protein